jgi:hypothetical protein
MFLAAPVGTSFSVILCAAVAFASRSLEHMPFSDTARLRLVSLRIVHFPRRVSLTAFCSHHET